MNRKIDFYGEVKEELGVIMAFSKIHEEIGFSKLVPSSAKGFDIDSIEYNGHDVTVEFEYLSGNFLSHGHQSKMDDNRKYVVVCWEDDCGLQSKLKEVYGKELYDLITLRKYINIKKENPHSVRLKEPQEPKYAVMAYNPNIAGGKDFSAWAFSHCYRIETTKKNPKFAQDNLPPGSKILFYQNGFIIGGFTVIRYEIIKRPRAERELRLYKKLTDYPASLYTVSIEEYKEGWLNGHIFYTDFFDIRDFKIRLSHFVTKKMSFHGKINLTKEEYNLIIGH
ncbi:MAG: hypothetical protein GWP06_09645 [Actinobacteria bacterium]|nr:hypothetical protein [Actinomycetota bacterium]